MRGRCEPGWLQHDAAVAVACGLRAAERARGRRGAGRQLALALLPSRAAEGRRGALLAGGSLKLGGVSGPWAGWRKLAAE